MVHCDLPLAGFTLSIARSDSGTIIADKPIVIVIMRAISLMMPYPGSGQGATHRKYIPF